MSAVKFVPMTVEYIDPLSSLYLTEDLKLAYTAGFIEADGCFHFQNSVSIRITNKCVPILFLFKGWWGGSIRSKGIPANCYDWNLHSDGASSLTEKLVPFLNMKKEEALLLIEYQSTVGARGRKVSEASLTKRQDLLQEVKRVRALRNNYFLSKEDLLNG